jgi:hypothetical protein
MTKTSTATISTTEGDLTLQRFPDKVPLAVLDFMNLAKRGFYSGIIMLALVAFPTVAPGEQPILKEAPQHSMDAYDPSSVETLKGRIVSTQSDSDSPDMILVIASRSEKRVDVHLGPKWFLGQNLPYEPGQLIEVTGSRVTLMGNPAILASSVLADDTRATFRDEKSGRPIWTGRGG